MEQLCHCLAKITSTSMINLTLSQIWVKTNIFFWTVKKNEHFEPLDLEGKWVSLPTKAVSSTFSTTGSNKNAWFKACKKISTSHYCTAYNLEVTAVFKTWNMRFKICCRYLFNKSTDSKCNVSFFRRWMVWVRSHTEARNHLSRVTVVQQFASAGQAGRMGYCYVLGCLLPSKQQS